MGQENKINLRIYSSRRVNIIREAVQFNQLCIKVVSISGSECQNTNLVTVKYYTDHAGIPIKVGKRAAQEALVPKNWTDCVIRVSSHGLPE